MDLESRLALDEDEPAVLAFVGENGGEIVRDEAAAGLYWLTLRPISQPTDWFYVRLAWAVYPHHAPSVLFAEAVGGAVGSARAWPSIPGYQPPSRICKPFTAEGFAAHAEWVWPTTGNRFLWVVSVLQDDLDTKYAGRGA
jgi:hypothetical protein